MIAKTNRNVRMMSFTIADQSDFHFWTDLQILNVEEGSPCSQESTWSKFILGLKRPSQVSARCQIVCQHSDLGLPCSRETKPQKDNVLS